MSDHDEEGTVLRPVPSLFVNCSLRVRNFGYPVLCASDCCGAPADSAVDIGEGRLMYRCPEHRGVVEYDQRPDPELVHFKVRTR